MCLNIFKCGPCNCSSCKKSTTDNVSYIGPNLPCTGVNINDSLTTVIQKIETVVCPLMTTTTTTTVAPSCYTFEAVMTNLGPNDPIINVMTNDFGPFNSNYISPGVYEIEFTAIPTPAQLAQPVLLLVGTSTDGLVHGAVSGTNTVTINTMTFDGTTNINDVLFNTSILIKKCN